MAQTQNPAVDFYFEEAGKWKEAIEALRSVILDCGLTEELKWGSPCYTFNKKNIVLIHTFKEYCALLFFKGALLKDTNGILVQQSENVQSARQVRFTNIKEVMRLRKILMTYVYQAVEIENLGLEVKRKKTTEYKMPGEFKSQLGKNSKLKKAFEALTPGRQRGYLLYFAAPKQTETRRSRVEKCIPKILEGKGLND